MRGARPGQSQSIERNREFLDVETRDSKVRVQVKMKTDKLTTATQSSDLEQFGGKTKVGSSRSKTKRSRNFCMEMGMQGK